ncbi:hypothetical protein EDB82DRAFT_531416 [Fusarium venenatum]|uniref:uncharacterized protein n=1 Tax=Fusarium venenatum TaxID=56646 RepID=UPI001D5FA5D8|nr:hypothetical protein EDB82DRAFT_531416 [Fusarium venenatum]
MASFSGWRRTALYLTILITTILIFLIVLLFLSLFHFGKNDSSTFDDDIDPEWLKDTPFSYKTAPDPEKDTLGLGILYKGDCTKSSEINLWIHLAINIIGTGILASSNFFMQSLVAPVRAEVDAAHKSGYWLEIGVPSIRNFRFLKRRNVFFWSLFCLSSIPLQLILNGVVLEAKSINGATLVLGSKELVKGGWHDQVPISVMGNDPLSVARHNLWDISKSLAATETRGNWEKLAFKDCMERYNNPDVPLTQYRHVIFIMYDYDDLNLTSTKGWKPVDVKKDTNNLKDINKINPVWGYNTMIYTELFGDPIQTTKVQPFPLSHYDVAPKWISNVWQIEDTTNVFDPVSGVFITDPRYFKDGHRVLQVDHCLSERFTAPCQVRIANSLLLIVCVMCAIKCVLCVLVLKLRGDEKPFITPGDAIASFIARPDEETKGMCTLNITDLKRNTIKGTRGVGDTNRTQKWLQSPRQWHVDATTRRFRNAVPRLIWLVTFVLIGSALITAMSMLIVAASDQPLNDSHFRRTRHTSEVAAHTFGRSSLVTLTVVANLPQLVLSFCYFTYNGLLTRILSELEWSKYSIKHRALRVTEPKGEQSSTYRLQLPYRFSVPLIIISTLLHWIYSNCIYVSKYHDFSPTYPYNIMSSLGLQFSTKAILIGLCVSLGAAIVPVVLAQLKLPGTMVIAGGNSAVISAACHYPSTKLRPIVSSRSSWQYDSTSVRLMANQELEELEELQEVARKKLKWGVLVTGNSKESLVGHLGFGTKDSGVGKPTEGEYYSGL